MNGTDRVLQVIVRATGGFQILLGALLWVGFLQQLTTLHMVVGLVFVLAVWVLAARAFAAGAGRALSAVAILWGVIVVALGMTQAQILPGPSHWVVRVAHLVVGVIAMGLAGQLGVRMNAEHPSRSDTHAGLKTA
jgi:hypothetical protein